MTIFIALIVLSWIGCGLLYWGIMLGTFTKEFPYRKNYCTFDFIVALFGPLALVAIVLFTIFIGKIGFRLLPISKEERYNIFQQEFSLLGRNHFERYHG